MSKRSIFTTVTPLPGNISRETAISTLHNHLDMIDLNPLVVSRHTIKPPSYATPEESQCEWYEIVDSVSYLPGTSLVSSKVKSTAAFHDLPNGLQTHIYAPAGLEIKGKWTLGGTLPGEPMLPVELGIGAPRSGLYIREDVDMTCNFVLTSFVIKKLKKAHSVLVQRMLVKNQNQETEIYNERLASGIPLASPFSNSSDADDGRGTGYWSQSHSPSADTKEGSIHTVGSDTRHPSYNHLLASSSSGASPMMGVDPAYKAASDAAAYNRKRQSIGQGALIMPGSAQVLGMKSPSYRNSYPDQIVTKNGEEAVIPVELPSNNNPTGHTTGPAELDSESFKHYQYTVSEASVLMAETREKTRVV